MYTRVPILGASDTVRDCLRFLPYINDRTRIQTVSAIYACFLAVILFPQVLRKAQAEIDKVVGSERLPTFEDRPHLPYINALVTSVFLQLSCRDLYKLVQTCYKTKKTLQDDK
jgi:Cytochrome P450